MAASSQSNASAQKDSGPAGGDKPGQDVLPCQKGANVKPLAQTITPKVTVNDAQRSFYGKAAPDRDEVGSITLGLDKSGDALGYKGSGSLTATNTNCTFYSDSKCKKKIDPASGPVKYKAGSLEGGVTVYYKGNLDGATQLSLTLDPASDGRITVKPPAAGTITAKQVKNEVKPVIAADKADLPIPFPDVEKVDKELHTFQPEEKPKDPPPVCKVTVSITASVAVEGYDKTGTVALSNANASVWLDAECKKAGGAPLTVSAADLGKGFSFYLRGETEGAVDVSLTLANTTIDHAEVETTAKKVAVNVQAVNRVTPYVKVEHLVVLKDPKLDGKTRKTDTLAGSAAAPAAEQINPDPVRVELSAKQTSKVPKPVYPGKATLVLTPANAKAFEDEACTRPFDLSTKLDFDKLTQAKPMELFLRGETAGLFTAELKLDDSNDPLVKVDGPAKGEMGCVEFKLKLFHYLKADVDQAIEPDVDEFKTYWNQLKGLKFEQKEMTDDERVGVGRLLQVQKDGNQARAKLTLECDAASWPAAAKDYTVVFDLADADKPGKKRSGSVAVFDKEEKGSEVKLPHTLAPKNVAKLKPWWVEGVTRCDAWRGIRLSVGIDRPDGGPAKVRRMDGAWATFTVVQIKEVKCDFDNEPAKEKFIDGDKVFINLDASGRLLKSVAGSRKADVTATIEPALQDVELYFSVVEHEDNYKVAKDVPKPFREGKLAKLKHTVKPIDRTDRKKLLTLSQKTDDKGVAKIETLQTPQFGLLKFRVGAYLMQSPRQACYVEGHSTLKKKAPTLSQKWFQVWRRIGYKTVAMDRFSGASYSDRFDGDALQGHMEKVGIEFERKAAIISKPYECAQPDFLQWTRDACGGQAPDRTIYLGLINGRGDKGDKDKTYNLGAAGGKTPSWNLPYLCYRSTANKPQWLTSCQHTHNGVITDVGPHTTLTQTEDFKFSVAVDLNALWNSTRATARGQALLNDPDVGAADAAGDAAADSAVNDGTIELKVKYADGSSGVSWHEAVVVCMDSREPDNAKQSAKDSATHTFMHEIGHYLGLGAKWQPDRDDTLNPNYYSDTEYSSRGKGGYGIGTHCDGLSDKCALWYQFKMTFAYCDMCNLMMRARAYAAGKANAQDKF